MSSKSNSPAQQRVKNALAALPLAFEVNHGQTGQEVKYLSHGRGYVLFLCEKEAVFSLQKPRKLEKGRPSGAETPPAVLRLAFVGSNPHPAISGASELPGKSNYFFGNRSITDVTTYSKVAYAGLYPGIDAVYYGNQKQLEYDFVVAPGANPAAIKLAVTGAEKAEVDARGDLVLTVTGKEVRQHKPVLYQVAGGVKSEVAGRYVLQGESGPGTRMVSFEVAKYDPSKPLVIDPVLVYSTFYGDLPSTEAAPSDLSGDDGGMGIALDSAGNAYVTGFTNSFEFPVLSWLQDYTYSAAYGIDHPPTLLQYLEVPNRPGAYHAFLSKFNQDSSQLVYSTYWGGGRDDVGVAVAVGSDNAPVVAGTTNSSSFNLKNALHVYAGGIDTFITKFTPGGNDVVFSTLLGGEFDDVCNDLALDSAGNVFVVGTTTSPNLSTANPLQPRNNSTAPNGSNGFVAKFRADGLVMLFCTYLGGHNNDGAMGVTTDASGNCYVVGFTTSPDFPLASPLQPQNNSTAPVPSNAFVAKLNPSGSLLVFSTYLGGSGEDQANSVAVDAGGNVYLAGYTKSSDFPTISPTVLPVQATNGGPPGTKDAFVSKISYLGNALLFSTYLGGAGDDEARRIVVDSRGAIYVAGSTQSDDFPLAPQTNTLQSARAKGVSGLSKSNADGFLAKFNPSGTPLVYSTYLGSTAHSFLTDNMVRAVPPILPVALDTWSEVRGLVTDNQGNAYVTGFTEGEFYHTFDAYSDIAPLPPAPGDKYPAPFKATITFPDGSVMPDPSEAIGDLAYLLGIQSGPISRMLPKSPVVGATSPRIVTGALQPAGTVSGVAALQLDGQWVYGIDDRDVYLAKIGDTSPLITSPQTLNVTVGAYINYIVTATNYPTSFNAAGLPPGLFISTSTGQIAGTTSVTGTFPVVLTASNAGGTGSQILVLNVSSQAPAIYSPLAATATVGKVFTYNIQAHFAPASFDAKSQPTSFDAQGQLIGLPLPTGLTVDTLSGFISGVPLNEAQTNVTITATNSWGHDAQTLVLTVMPAAPVITSAAVAQGVLNQPFSYTITATGNPTSYTAAQLPPATGLPPGLTLDPGTGVISGTPTTLGNFSVALTATNGGGTGTGQLSLSIIPGLVPIISSPDTAFAAVGRPFSYTITANNNPQAFSITVDATVTAVASGTQFTAAGLINEGPFVGHPLTVVSGAAVNQTVTITAFDRSTGALTVNSALAGLTGGDTFYVRALPLQLEPNFLDGLTLDTTLGLLSGTPTVNSAGRPFHLTLRATNAAGTGTKVLQLIVYKPERPFISSPDTATATVGTAFEYDIAANGPTTAATGQVSAFFVPVQFTSANLINKGPFVGQTLKLTSGAGVGQTWTVNAFAPATGTCTLNRPFSGAVGDTFTFPALFSSTGLITQPPLALAGLTLRMTSGAAINQTWTVNAFNPPTGTCALNSVFTGAIGDTFTFISPQFFSNNLSGPGPFVGLTLTMTSGAALNQTWTINAFNAISGTFTLNSNFTGATNDNFSINTVPAATTGSVTGLVPPAGTPGTVTSLPGGTVSSVPSSGFSSTDLLNSGPFASQTMSMKSGAAINIVWTITSFDPLTGTITLDKFFGGGVGDNFSINIPSVTNLPANAVNGFVTTLNSQTIFQSDHLKGVTPAAVLLNYPNNFTMTSGLNAGTGATKTVTAFDPTTGTVTIDSAFNNLVAVSDAFAIALQPYNAPGLPPSNDLVINTGTGAIKGTPTVADTVPSTVWPVMIQSSNSAGRSTLVNPDLTSKAMTLTIQPLDPPVITSPGKATAVVGVPFSYTITATNGPTSYNATLPPALAATLSVNTVTGVISGTPAAGTTGVYNVTLTATNGIGPGTRPLQLTISLPVPPVITSPLNTLGIDGAPFTYTITATGTMPISYSAISVVQVGAVTQVLSGTQISSLDLDEPTAFVAIEKPITMLSGAAAGQTSTVLAFDLVTAPDGTTQGRITFGPAFTAPLAAGDKFSVVLSSQPLPQLLSIQNKTDPTTGQTTGVIAGRPIQAGTFNVLLSASNLATAPTNPGTPATTATLVLVINPTAPVITNTDLTATGVEGVPFSYTVQATGTQPLTIGVLDATPLPAGLTLSASAMNSQGIVQAIISGTPLPAAVGTTTVTLTAANHVTPLPNTATLTINISPAPPIITSPLTASAVDGIPFSYTITATGTPPVTFTATGLPNGLSLAGTTISGTPSGQIGSFNVILTATNSPLTTPDQKTLVITVAPAPPTITSLLTATANDGKPFSYTITASGTPPFTFSAAPPLPNGLALNGANITGTPVGPGTFTVVITAANLAGSDQKNLTITVNPTPPSITSPLTALAADGAPFTYTLTATGSAIISFGASNLPPGLALQGAVISGTPLGPAVTDVVLTATNPYGTDTKTLVLTVAPAPPVITDSTGHNFTEIAPPGNPFSYTITATGTLPIFFQAGNLPPGLSLSGAVISGTPTTIGVAKVSLIATNNIGHDQKTLVINVQPTSPSITSLLSAIGKDGVPFSYQITAFGSLPMTFGASPLPAGLSIAPLTGIISGTPTQPQVYNLAITATNNVSPFTDTKTLVITIQPSVQITSPLTAFGIVGQPFKVYTVTATGTAPIALSVDATSLPPGLTFSTSGNTISGTPTTAGIYYVSLTASNIAGSVVQVVAINIAQPSDDSDGDGFPNDLEIALGTDPNGINSTPFDGRPAGAVLIPTISNMSIKLDFTKAGKDSISIQGILPLVQNVAPGSETMTLVVGGIVRVFTLDKHGKAAQAFGNYLAPRTAAPGKNTFSLRVPKPYTQGTFTAALANTSGDFKKALGNPDIGLTNATVSLVPRTVRVYILLDKTTLYQVDELLFYTAKLNKTGIAKIR